MNKKSDFAMDVRAAETALRALFDPTPMHRNVFLSARFGADIWLKREDLSPVRSYKIRGAFNAMRKALLKNPEQVNFVCASAGNHAQGVAYACSHFGTHGVIFMPVTTPQQKIEKTRQFGHGHVEIRLVGDYFDETLSAAQDFCASEGAQFLPPFDDADVIEGQATCVLEAIDQLPGGTLPDVLILPVGGGGLSAGATRFAKTEMPDTEVVLVEPTGAPSLTQAIAQGEPVTLDTVDNFVDGASVARIGEQNFQVLSQSGAGPVLLAPEDRICATMLEMLNIEGFVLEPAGAMSIDALQDLPDIAGKTIVAVVSGGNFDFERLPDVKERALRWEGLKRYYILRMPQRPGALKDFLNLLGPEDDIARFEYLKKSARNFGSVLIGIETGSCKNFDILEAAMTEGGFTFQNITDDTVITNLIV